MSPLGQQILSNYLQILEKHLIQQALLTEFETKHKTINKKFQQQDQITVLLMQNKWILF